MKGLKVLPTAYMETKNNATAVSETLPSRMPMPSDRSFDANLCHGRNEINAALTRQTSTRESINSASVPAVSPKAGPSESKNMALRYPKQLSNDSERNMTQPTMVRKNVTTTPRTPLPLVSKFQLFFMKRSAMSSAPWYMPQIMNVHAAPCHSPQTKNTINKFK